jgi:hypothetical protein
MYLDVRALNLSREIDTLNFEKSEIWVKLLATAFFYPKLEIKNIFLFLISDLCSSFFTSFDSVKVCD